MKLFDFKFLILLALALVVYFIYKELENQREKILYCEEKIKQILDNKNEEKPLELPNKIINNIKPPQIIQQQPINALKLQLPSKTFIKPIKNDEESVEESSSSNTSNNLNRNKTSDMKYSENKIVEIYSNDNENNLETTISDTLIQNKKIDSVNLSDKKNDQQLIEVSNEESDTVNEENEEKEESPEENEESGAVNGDNEEKEESPEENEESDVGNEENEEKEESEENEESNASVEEKDESNNQQKIENLLKNTSDTITEEPDENTSDTHTEDLDENTSENNSIDLESIKRKMMEHKKFLNDTSEDSEDFEENKVLIERLRDETWPETGKPIYTLASGLSLMVFYVYAMQCMATFAVVKRETKSWKWPIIQLVYMGVLAYLAAFITFTIFT
jgi:cobalamin biosynthesis protein CobT